MNVVFDHEQLLALMTNLYTLTGIRANILDDEGRDICLYSGHPEFCTLMNGTEEGHRRCLECDACAVRTHATTAQFRFYRCHAGLLEAVMPIRDDGDQAPPLAYLIFGGFLDDTNREAQWAFSRAQLDWYPGDREELRRAYFRLRQYEEPTLRAYAEILEALTAYIRLKKMVQTAEHTELQKLALYLDGHYMEKLSLETVSAQLHIGRTKLCTLARELSGGHTLTWLIAQRRINAAKTLLRQSSCPISAVAEAVGISDYNYFSKIFRSVTGMTPSAFRKGACQDVENLR